jgi:hypothetical protein
MKLTNKFGLPDAIMRAYGQETGPGVDPVEKVVRCTTLIRPPQITALELQHGERLAVDISTRLHIMCGTAWHAYVEEHSRTSEVALKARYGEWTVTGTADVIDGPILTDWKTTNTNKIMWRDYHEWECQLNVYRALAMKMNMPVIAVQVWAYLRDWTQAGADKNSKYPRSPMVLVPLPTWTLGQADAFILSRLRDLEEALAGSPRECSGTETWGGRRCARYCSVSGLCPQMQRDALREEERKTSHG